MHSLVRFEISKFGYLIYDSFCASSALKEPASAEPGSPHLDFLDNFASGHLHYDIKTIGKPVSESTLEMRRLHVASMAIAYWGLLETMRLWAESWTLETNSRCRLHPLPTLLEEPLFNVSTNVILISLDYNIKATT